MGVTLVFIGLSANSNIRFSEPFTTPQLLLWKKLWCSYVIVQNVLNLSYYKILWSTIYGEGGAGSFWFLSCRGLSNKESMWEYVFRLGLVRDAQAWWWRWIIFVVWLTDERRFSLISSREYCQRSSPSRISDTARRGFEPPQNLSSDFIEWSCEVMITTTPRRHK